MIDEEDRKFHLDYEMPKFLQSSQRKIGKCAHPGFSKLKY
jgi:hypothetical protein